MISISSNRRGAGNENKTCMSENCNNIPKNGLDYCKNHKPKPKKCQFKGCGNNTKIHLRYCGLHSPNKSKQPTSQIRKLRSGTYQVQSSIKNRHSISSQSQSNLKSIIKAKKSCKYIGCKNTVSTGKRYCGLHYLEEGREHINQAHKPRQDQYKISAKRYDEITHEKSTKGTFVCDICGKDNTAGRIAKGVGKTVGNTTLGVFGTLTFLTGGLTAPLMLGAGMIGVAISGSAEKYSLCAECRAK